MTDIVERARLVASSSQHMGELLRIMADEIERLRERETDAKQLAADNFERVKRAEAEIERLRAERDELFAANGEVAGFIAQLQAALKECADDLESWINHHYEKTMDYPSEKSRYERDMESVLIARKLLGQVPE